MSEEVINRLSEDTGASISDVKNALERTGNDEDKARLLLRPEWGCAAEGKLEELKTMLELGVDPNQVDRFGDTALEAAARFGQVEALALLLKHSHVAIEGGDQDHPPLARSCAYGARTSSRLSKDEHRRRFTDCVRALLEAGANPNASARGLTCLEIASADATKEIVELLLQHGADASVGEPLIEALQSRREAADKAIVLHRVGAKVGAALVAAAQLDDYEQATTLCGAFLAAGADVNAVSDDGTGFTALVWAVSRENVDLARLLLEYGAQDDIPIISDAIAQIGIRPGQNARDLAAKRCDEIRALFAAEQPPAELDPSWVPGRWSLYQREISDSPSPEEDGIFAGSDEDWFELGDDGMYRARHHSSQEKGSWKCHGDKLILERQKKSEWDEDASREFAYHQGRLESTEDDDEHGCRVAYRYRRATSPVGES